MPQTMYRIMGIPKKGGEQEEFCLADDEKERDQLLEKMRKDFGKDYIFEAQAMSVL